MWELPNELLAIKYEKVLAAFLHQKIKRKQININSLKSNQTQIQTFEAFENQLYLTKNIMLKLLTVTNLYAWVMKVLSSSCDSLS